MDARGKGNGADRFADRAAGPAAAAVVAAAGVALVAWWMGGPGAPRLSERLPVSRPEPAVLPPAARGGTFETSFRSFGGTPSSLPGRWPRFRGADLSNVSREAVPLAERWGPEGPPRLWTVDLGEGHAGPAVAEGRVYVLDYDEAAESDALRCFSLDDGREIWRRSYRTGARRNHGVSRTVPAVAGPHVVTLGPRCHVLCVDASTGAFRWGIDLAARYGTREPLWYASQCPLVDGNRAIIAPGGRALMIAVDCATGKVLWETPNPKGWQMSHSSVVPMEYGGRRMYVYCASGGMAGVAADGPDAGAVLWETGEWNHMVVAPTPVVLPEGRIFVTAGYGAGSALFRLRKAGARFAAERVYALDRKVFGCEQQTPVHEDGLLFAVLPKDAGAAREEFACLDPGGRLLWTSGKDHRFGLGPFLAADGKFLILADDGTLTLARAKREGFRALAKAKVLGGTDAWAPMAIVGGRLLLRDSRRLVCLDLREGAA